MVPLPSPRPESVDLSGPPNAPDQFNLFGEGADRLQVPTRPAIDHASRARAKLTAVLNTARAARTMPWSDRDVSMWQTVFPQMCGWLPSDEAEQLQLQFSQEIERLRSARAAKFAG